MSELNSVPSGFQSVEEAQKHFDSRASLYNDRNVAAIIDGLADDVEIEYGELPVMGKKEFEGVLSQRFKDMTQYHLNKTVRFVVGNQVVTDLDIRWAGAASDGELRRSRALEILTFREKKIIKWELVSCLRPSNLD
ncbi:hypothetical protein [Cupriavidus necator]